MKTSPRKLAQAEIVNSYMQQLMDLDNGAADFQEKAGVLAAEREDRLALLEQQWPEHSDVPHDDEVIAEPVVDVQWVAVAPMGFSAEELAQRAKK